MDNMIVSIEYTKEPTKKHLELVSAVLERWQETRSIHKIIFVYTSHEQLESKI